MKIRTEPASFAHLLAMASASAALQVPRQRSAYRLIGAQMAVSDSFALFEGGDAVPFAILGGAYLPAGGIEAWFIVRPGGLSTAALLAVVRTARAKLDAAGQRVICFVRCDNRKGERLARAVGFAPGENLIGDHQEWRRGA